MSKARDLADSAQEINILDGKSFLDEDNLASDSATGIASQQSIKAYVDGITTTNITSTGALNSGSITSGFGNIDNGSSTITTTGAITGGSFVIGSADINENDLESIDGITAGTVSASKAVVVNTNKDITGFRNITATGTISGSLSGTLSGAIASTTTATTQAESDDSTKVATTAYVTDKITTLIGGAPSTLNDLNELAAAINDDANYNSTLTTALATKLPLAGGTMTGDVLYNDNIKAKFGAGSDLQIYHDGSNSHIEEAGGGNLRITTNGPSVAINKGTVGGENMAVFNADGAVQLFYDNASKLATTSTGIAVTGDISNASGSMTINSANDLTLDVVGNIHLDAADGNVFFKDGGTEFFKIRNTGSDVQIYSARPDADMKFEGVDGSVGITALHLDMSDAGTAIFNHNIKLPDNGVAVFGAGTDMAMYSDGTNGVVNVNNGNLTLDVAGDITFDSDSGYIWFNDGGTTIGYLKNESTDLSINVHNQSRDMLFKGNDDGSTITALTLDMSNAGKATFNNGLIANGDISLGDSKYLLLGNANDFQIFHNGADSYLFDNGTGNLNLTTNGASINLRKHSGGENMLVAVPDGSVSLYHDNSKKIETTSSGVTVTGTVAATSFTGSGANLTGIESGLSNATSTGPSSQGTFITNPPGSNAWSGVNGQIHNSSIIRDEAPPSSIIVAEVTFPSGNNLGVVYGTLTFDEIYNPPYGAYYGGHVFFVVQTSTNAWQVMQSIYYVGGNSVKQGTGTHYFNHPARVLGSGHKAYICAGRNNYGGIVFNANSVNFNVATTPIG